MKSIGFVFLVIIIKRLLRPEYLFKTVLGVLLFKLGGFGFFSINLRLRFGCYSLKTPPMRSLDASFQRRHLPAGLDRIGAVIQLDPIFV